MPRQPQRYGSQFSFGMSPLTPSIKLLIGANVIMFVARELLSVRTTLLDSWLALIVTGVLHGQIWRLATYMFLHASLWHLLFNMLALWMIGGELERVWGPRYFLKFYMVTGIGAAVLTVLIALVMPASIDGGLRFVPIIGASGAIYALLLAFALYFPDRPILAFMIFPMPAKYFVLLLGAIAFYSSLADNSGVANVTHLGGLLVGYLYLKGGRFNPLDEAKYWYLRWKMQRTRRKFDVYSGGRANDWNRRVH